MFGRKGCEDKRSSGQELFGTLQMLILHAVGLQLAFPSATDRWVPTEHGGGSDRTRGSSSFGWICNPPELKKRICNPHSYYFALQMLILHAVGLQIRPNEGVVTPASGL